MKLRKFMMLACVLLAAVPACAYDVTVPHVVINQVFGGTGGYVSHNFIELYNPTDETVNLSSYALHYRSSSADAELSDQWYKLDLEGEIPAHHSYLVRCAEDTSYTRTGRTITSYDISFVRGGAISVFNKGLSVILTSNQNDIPSDSDIFDNETKTPLIDGYVDMLAAAGNDYGKDGYDSQAPFAYESAFSAVQSKKSGIRRVKFRDTDDNEADTQAADYSASDVSAIFPRCVANGEWGNEDERTVMLKEIEDVKAGLPKFYETYCTEETAGVVTAALAALDEAVSNDADVEELAVLLSNVEAAAKGLVYKSDEKVAQIYIATDKGNGESYGTTLTKAIGYVKAQITCVDAGGEVMASDNSWASQVKVRGNSTAGGAKRPYNIKFKSGVDLFGFGKAKKWALLADLYDPTLMRNRIALTLGAEIGLEATPGNHRVEVWMDGVYRGMYLLTEKIEADDNRVNIKAKKGDFLIETVVAGEEEAGNIYLTSSSGQKFRLREPEDENKIESIKAVIDNFEDVIASGTWEEVSEIIDLDSMVSYYVLNEYMRTYDWGWPKSVYFHYKDGKFCGGPAWDFDYSSGNESSNPSTSGAFISGRIYYKHLTKFPEFMTAIYKKFWEVHRSGVLENLYKADGFIDDEVAFYAEAIERNNAVWSVSASRPSWNRVPDETYEENLEFLRTWLQGRDEWMRSYYINGVFEDDEGIYYYVNNQKTAVGFIEFDGYHYYAGTDGKISTGTFTVNDNSYTADDTGKISIQSLTLALSGSNSLTTTVGTQASLTLTASLSASYGEGITDTITPDSITWSLESGLSSVSLTDGTLTVDTSAIPGTYQLIVKASASYGDLTTSTQKTLTLTVNPQNSDDFIPADPAKPQFAYQSLMLEGQIGVNFYLYLPAIDGINYSDGTQCWMDFYVSNDVSGNSQVLDGEFSFTENNMTFYGFRCYINSIQMADKITAVFHYGGQSITKEYSAKEYLDNDFSAFPDDTQALIASIKDYGYYSQKMLAKTHGWTFGKEHAAMNRASTYSDDDLSNVADNVKAYAIDKGNIGGSGIESIEYSLNLDSSTAINIYLNLSDDYAGEVYAYLDGGTVSIAEPDAANNGYKIKIDDIPAHKLGKTYTLKITAAKAFEVKVSALSYVNAVLNNDAYKSNTELREAVCAIYDYYTATMNYRQTNGYKD